MNQYKLKIALVLIILGQSLLNEHVIGQTLKVRINVNSTVGMQQLMPFEVMPVKKMYASINEPTMRTRSIDAMGAYTLTGKENTDILIRIDVPDVLINKENQTMPYKMKLAWNNSAAGDINNLNWSNGKNSVLKLSKSLKMTEMKTRQDNDPHANLYLKGTAEIPVIANSPFEGKILLTIEY